MKTTSAALITYLNALRPTSDAPLYVADLFTITLLSGTILTYCDVDQPVSWNGSTYLANSLLVSGLRYKGSCGLNVDKQQIVIAARSTDTLGGIPFLQALAQGALDGATIQREKAFFSSWAGRKQRDARADRDRDSVQGPRRANRRNRPHHGENHRGVGFGAA